MPAILGTSIIDVLVPVIDNIRGVIHPVAGDRQWRVYLVKRSWGGSRVGEGSVNTTTTTEITPQPRVQFGAAVRALRYESQPQGREEEGDAMITEVSLRYTESELQGGTLERGDEFYIKLVDAKGQGLAPRYFTLSGPPVPDNEKDIGWVLFIRQAHVEE